MLAFLFRFKKRWLKKLPSIEIQLSCLIFDCFSCNTPQNPHKNDVNGWHKSYLLFLTTITKWILYAAKNKQPESEISRNRDGDRGRPVRSVFIGHRERWSNNCSSTERERAVSCDTLDLLVLFNQYVAKKTRPSR